MFTPDLGALTLDQCKNIAYEIVWSQQPPPPSPPDPVEDLYTNPPNNGALFDGSTPNQSEGGRQQFEAQLNSYYTVANATADRLTNFVFAVSAAIACQQQSLAATQALDRAPAQSRRRLLQRCRGRPHGPGPSRRPDEFRRSRRLLLCP